MNQYIITGEELDMWQIIQPMSPMSQELREKARSRPYNPQAEREKIAIGMNNHIGALESLEPDKYSENWFEIQVLKKWRDKLREGKDGV